MESKALSLLQVDDSLNLGSNNSFEEEKEALEDQKRRDVELGNLLNDAFDDLTDDEDDDGSSIYSASQHNDDGKSDYLPVRDTDQSQHYQHCCRRAVQNSGTASDGDQQQLQLLYEVRVREIDRLSQQLLAAQQEKGELRHQAALLEAEKTRFQALLASSQAAAADLEKENADLRRKLSSLEKLTSEVEGELRAARNLVKELEERQTLLERQGVASRQPAFNTYLQDLQKRHENEVLQLQAQLASREQQCTALETRVAELTRAHDTLLVDKSNTINQLARSLEESQRDNANLRLVTAQYDRSAESPRGDLRTELHRCLAGQKLKKEQIKKLKLQLEEKEYVITMLRSQESKRDSEAVNSKKNAACLSAEKAEEHTDLASDDKKSSLQEGPEMRVHTGLLESQKSVVGKEGDLENLEGKLVETKLDGSNEAPSLASGDWGQQGDRVGKQQAAGEGDKSERPEKVLQQQLAACEQQNEELRRQMAAMVREEAANKAQLLASYGEQYLSLHAAALARARTDAARSMEQRVAELSARLEQVLSEADRVKQLYVELQASKQELQHRLEEERKQTAHITEQVRKETRQSLQLHWEEQLAQEARAKQQLEHECQELRARSQELEAAAKCSQQQLDHLQKELRQRDAMLQEKELELANHIKPPSTDASTSPVKVIEDLYLETVKCEIRNAYKERLNALEANHQKQLEDTQEQIKDETVRFFAAELKSTNMRHRVELQKLHRSYGEKLTNLQHLINEKRKEVGALQEQLETDRAVVAGLMKNWAVEVQELRASEQEARLKYQQLHSRYQAVKKVAIDCKSYALELEGRL